MATQFLSFFFWTEQLNCLCVCALFCKKKEQPNITRIAMERKWGYDKESRNLEEDGVWSIEKKTKKNRKKIEFI